MTLHYTQASAGSGKTYRIQQDVADKLERGELLPSEIIAVTFTKDAAAELKGRISEALLARGNIQLAAGIMSARIGTVHSVFGQLLSDFAFELGLSPEQRVLEDSDKTQVLAEALDSCLSENDLQQLNHLGNRLSVEDWRKDVLKIIELMRANAMHSDTADKFANDSISSLKAGNIDSLDYSWRSRAGLVELSNELFTQPFSHLLKSEQVKLTPKREEPVDCVELAWWTLSYEKKNKDNIMAALAEGIQNHISSGVQVLDKDTKKTRYASWEDLAVLCYTNKEAADLAGQCAQLGIPVSLERTGLLETPEVSLALACLRRLIDPADALASAEILALCTGQNLELWLQDRLAAVAAGEASVWNSSAHPVLTKLDKARQHVGLLSTKEAFTLAMLAGDVNTTVCKWRETAKLTEQRLANLVHLTNLVDDYENHCLAQFSAATPTGFILWLKALEQRSNDQQAANSGNAITITTYHKSKGLEWPIVICSSLDSSLKVSLFGPRITNQGLPFDWLNPLNGRSLCYWPYPFPDQKGKEILSERLAESDEYKAAELQARNEAIQLLYVGITRARDQLVLTAIGEEDNVGDWLKLLNTDLLPPAAGVVSLHSGTTLTVEKATWEKSHMPAPVTLIFLLKLDCLSCYCCNPQPPSTLNNW